jgi:hypothetical protein
MMVMVDFEAQMRASGQEHQAMDNNTNTNIQSVAIQIWTSSMSS